MKTIRLNPLELTAFARVRPPRGLRKLTLFVGGIFLLLPIVLLTVPWQQNIPGGGQVTALDPLERSQTIPVPVTGRLARVLVRDGSVVKKGDLLAELVDQDPRYTERLLQQTNYAQDEVSAARGQYDFYVQQLVHLEDAREEAINGATFELNVAIEKVRAVEQELDAMEADYDQKRIDRDRKDRLAPKGVVSVLDQQKSQADYVAARSKVGATKAKVEQARNEERSKMAKINQISADHSAKIESAKTKREEARAKLAAAEKKRTEAETKLDRQKTQTVLAPRDGYVMRVHAAASADLLIKGEPLIELIPEMTDVAVELWVRGIDAPLITPGRKVRLQFEGWPAVQFSGWPSVAVGTFGGVVAAVDAQGTSDGRFRVIVRPDPDDKPWPELPYLRQGVRANGWLMLDTVSLGYELWRQLNAFPPSIDDQPAGSGSTGYSSKQAKSKEDKE